jgi:hypothetical protein
VVPSCAVRFVTYKFDKHSMLYFSLFVFTTERIFEGEVLLLKERIKGTVKRDGSGRN